jgi:predicted lipoprotein with Yx(FWY)xxD motif
MNDMNAGGANAGDPAGMPGMGSGGVELYAVQTGTLGIVVTDGAGRLLYGSAGDANNPPTSHCSGACAQEWQPLVVPKGQKPELLGVDARHVGLVGRDDGSSQLTLGGWPAYVNRDDDGGLKAAAPAAHGAWFVMTPQGGKIQI